MKKGNKKGFSLIELMVVIAIIGILATAGISMYSTYQAKARDSKRTTDLNQITVGLQGYYTDNGSYPEAKSWNCISDDKWVVGDALLPYYDNKNIPVDRNARVTWDCTTKGSFYYKRLSKQSTDNQSYILATNLEDKASFNTDLADAWSKTTYEDAKDVVWALKNAADRQAKKTIDDKNKVYAILN